MDMHAADITGAEAIASDLYDRGVRAAIFDIDGTLIDSMPIWDDLGARYLKGLGVTPDQNLGQILFPMTIAEGCRYLKQHYELTQSEDEIRDGLNQITETFYRDEVPLKEGAAELLAALFEHRIPMVLATIGESSLEEAALQRLGVDHYFGKMFECETYHTTKKEAKIYEIAADFLGVEAEHVAVFEDIYQAVHSAHDAGFFTAAVYDDASRSDWGAISMEADVCFDGFDRMAARMA